MFNKWGFGRQNCGCQMPMQDNMQQGCSCNNEVVEPTITKCIEKEFYHEVPHVCPIHTHVINKHIYTHKYTPQYTMDQEDVVINNDCGNCSGF